MRYLLVVGFACDVFRREPRARIFVGDKLVDEFYITNHKSNHFTSSMFHKNNHILCPYSGLDLKNFTIKNFPPLRFYELEIDNSLDRIILRIEIKNIDSNYTNGFLTSSTLLQLRACYFFPMNQTLLDRMFAIKNKNLPTENYAWYKSIHSVIFDLPVNGICWVGANGQKKKQENNFSEQFKYTNIGGNGNFYCELKKKYGIFISKLASPCKHTFNQEIMNYLIHKYKQDAYQ